MTSASCPIGMVRGTIGRQSRPPLSGAVRAGTGARGMGFMRLDRRAGRSLHAGAEVRNAHVL